MKTDRCCPSCRTPFGVCSRSRACHCHVEHAKEQAFHDRWNDAQIAAQRRAQMDSERRSREISGHAPWR